MNDNDDMENMVSTLEGKTEEVFTAALSRLHAQIYKEEMDFLFLLLDNPAVMDWFDEETQNLARSFVKLTDIRNSLEDVYWAVPKHLSGEPRSEQRSEEVSIDPYDMPSGEQNPLHVHLDARLGL